MNILPQHCTQCAAKDATIARLSWNAELAMHNRAGLDAAIEELTDEAYIIVFCDIDRLKQINNATGSHLATNRYLREGLRVRAGEIAGQLYGDEIVFVLQASADVQAFLTRIRRQLARQPLTQEARRELILAGGDGRLSATFAWRRASKETIWAAIEACSVEVLERKKARP